MASFMSFRSCDKNIENSFLSLHRQEQGCLLKAVQHLLCTAIHRHSTEALIQDARSSAEVSLYCCPYILLHNWTVTRRKEGTLMLRFYKEVLSITSACSTLVTCNDFTIGRLHTSKNVLWLQLCHETTFLFFACLPFFFFLNKCQDAHRLCD